MPAQPFAAVSTERMAVKSVAVFLAANMGNDPKYEDLTRQVATMFVENEWKLVYGGSHRGLMGVLGQTASALGVDVHGVKPRPFLKYEETGGLPEYGRHEFVEDLYSQKKRMAELSDAFIILPGGFGTLEEYTAIRMWSKLGVCRRPIVLLNFQNYYTPLLDWVTNATKLGFISKSSASVVSIVNTIEEMRDLLSRPIDTVENDEPFTWSAIVPRDSDFQELQEEKLLFNAADQVALRHALTTTWSTWHTWDYYNRIEPHATEANEHLWKEISPFATCVGMTFQVAKNLRASLANTPGLAQCLGKLKTVACPWPAESEPCHCLVGVFLEKYCLVVDLIYSAKAFKVPYNGTFRTLPYITGSSRPGRRRFRYVAGPSGQKTLTMETVGSDDVAARFSEIDHHTALQKITLPSAQETKPGLRVPDNKGIVVRSTMSERPTQIASTPVDAEFIVTTCLLKIEFEQRVLTMQLPFADWLRKPQNVRYLSRLQLSPIYEPVNDAVAHLVVDLSSTLDDDTVQENLRLMGEIGERLGLARGEIMRIAGLVDRVWRS